jgi:L-aminoadipate-semialdehyde dehydrogenase
MGALKAGATVSVIDPQYPPERQTVLLDVAKPRFLVCIEKANEEFGPPSDLVLKFASDNLSLKSTIPALELLDNGELRGGSVNGKDSLDPSVYSREDPASVLIGPDSIPTLSFTSGSEGRPKVRLLIHPGAMLCRDDGLPLDSQINPRTSMLIA